MPDSQFLRAYQRANGDGGGGCLKLSMAAGVDTQVNPSVEVTFNTTGYYCVEFDIIVDAGSRMDGSGTYGNLQVVTRDASWAWASSRPRRRGAACSTRPSAT